MWTNVFSTFKKDKSSDHGNSNGLQPPKTECFVYDLYAVCNHHGDDLQGGHYTATCRNPTDGQWYSFDDMHTSKVEENDVVGQDAYILFYQRQSLTSNPSSSASSSAGSSTCSSGNEHWVYRMPDFNYKNKTASLTKAQQQANVRAVTSGSNFTRNKGGYATMPVVKSESNMEVKNVAESDKKDEKVENETNSEKLREKDAEVTEESKSLNGTEISTTEEVDDVSRPIDKNDVD